jgi:hypothetical protein
VRSSILLIAALVTLATFMPVIAGVGSGEQGRSAPVAATTTPAPAPAPDNDAAAKHARRTACLKEAKARKLVGAQKSAFLKDCIGAP